MNKQTLSLFALLCLALAVQAKIPATQRVRLTENWEFLRQDLGSIWEAVRPAEPGSSEAVPVWSAVTLPHCFNADDAVDPDVNYYQGPGWHRTLLDIQSPVEGERILLEFEGAGQKTEVYLYTTLVGSHVGGYDEWSLDITEAIQAVRADETWLRQSGGRIPLIVRCDNSRDVEMIPSDLSDFNLYGGLYRYVNLIRQPELSFRSLQVDTEVARDLRSASLRLYADFYNPADHTEAMVEISLKDPSGKVVLRDTQTVLPLGRTELGTFTMKNPHLWSTDRPQLYTCEFTLITAGSRQTVSERVGFRRTEFMEQGPFLLNGQRLLLRGTHRHEDHAGVGAAMTEEQMTAEMRLMKEMGVNFIRLGHYQQSDIILSLCDELGILVWEEIPWCRGGLGGPVYKEQARRMLTNMIVQHRNHPSVIIWGMGNENDWPGDFTTFEESEIRAFMKELNDLSHTLDPSRKTAIRRCDFCKDIVDVYSPSIWAGWYRGMFTDYKSVSEAESKRVKHFLHVEWGGDSHAGRHAKDPFLNLERIESGSGADERAGDASLYGGNARASRDGDWSESYMVKLIDWHLKEQETMPWLTGTAYWPFKDFSTPLRPDNPVPYVNQKGVVERDLTPKESFYVFQSYWTTRPMLHIYGHSWPVRWGAEGEEKEILVYSNCAEVELFVNGTSQGVKRRDSQDFPAAGLRWNCVLQPGENRIEAVAIQGKDRLKDEILMRYETCSWGVPAQICLTTRDSEAGAWIDVQLADGQGVPCLDDASWVSFEIAGDGKLMQNRGTSTGSRKVQTRNGRASIQVALTGECVVAVKSEHIPTAYIHVKKP